MGDLRRSYVGDEQNVFTAKQEERINLEKM